MKIQKFLKVDQDVLLEWIYDSEKYITEDYRIIVDTLSNTRSFSNTENTDTKNSTKNQLFKVSDKKWGIVDHTENNKYHFLQFKNYSGNVPYRYDTIRLHFPVNYTFKDKIGCLLNISLWNKQQTIKFPISNYFYDKTDASRLDLDYGIPFLFNEKLWGKYIEFQVPSPVALIDDISNNNGVRIPKNGNIHKNLVVDNINVLSEETPIIIDFQFLTVKNNKLNQISYLTTEPFSTSIPYTPEFETLGLTIQPSSEGDYFEIFGVYDSTISGFNNFINKENNFGKSYHVIYDITTYEKNILTNQQSISQTSNFDSPILFRPIIRYTSTTAIIDVVMKLINAVDDSVITRTSTYVLLQEEVGLYARYLTKLNMTNTYKPKIYNSKPDILNVSFNKSNDSKQIVSVPYAVAYERINISIKNISESSNDTVYYGQGQQQILLYPSSNIYKFNIVSSINSKGTTPYQLPTASPIFMRFKSNNSLVEVPVYYDTNEVDLANGTVLFHVAEGYYDTLKKMYSSGFDQFYIVIKAENGMTTTLYFGRFLILDNK